MSIRLYVGNLPKESVDRQALHAIFEEFGEEVSTKVIKDRKTGKCRGFAFVTVPTDEMADQVIEKHNGQAFMESTLKIEKALPREKAKVEKEGGGTSSSTPTPSPKRAPAAKKRATTSSSSGGSVQPDPRWADDLAKLKEMLSAQTSSS
ncbi:RNA recognition motif domain-containing protein [Spirulina major]|uniref:RNA recognition motif domain-containing protein n=1 Tax=Spirulina major TaxID=270636 RepID=UPI000934454E|nr:RNA-binding protein [Spirulina major]